jgi:hypothetical protein
VLGVELHQHLIPHSVCVKENKMLIVMIVATYVAFVVMTALSVGSSIMSIKTGKKLLFWATTSLILTLLSVRF